MAMTDVKVAYTHSCIIKGKPTQAATIHLMFDDIAEATRFAREYTTLIGTNYEGLTHTPNA